MAAKKAHGPPREPGYRPEKAATRAEGQVKMRLRPEEARAWREWAEEHGGLAALARYLLRLRGEL